MSHRICGRFMAVSALLVLVAVAAPAQAALVISINVNEASGRAPMSADDLAGAPGARVANWNNFNAGNATLPGSIASPIAGSFVYNDGTVVGGSFAVSVTAPGGWVAATDKVNDALMYHASSGIQTDGGQVKFDFTGIPFAQYDIYVYAMGQPTNVRGGSVEVVDGDIFYVRGGTAPADDGSGYVLMTTTVIPEVKSEIGVANYARFENLSGSSQTVIATAHLWGDHARMQVYGIQIVEIPEPATAALLGLGSVVMIIRRRSRNRTR
jgi:hypothetical protein